MHTAPYIGMSAFEVSSKPAKGCTLQPLDDGIRRTLEENGYKLEDGSPILYLSQIPKEISLYRSVDNTDLSSLADANIKVLGLRNCSCITDVSVLAESSTIETLYLNGCNGIRDVSPLAGLKTLKTLYLSGCQHITDVSALGKLPALEHLHLTWCIGITSVSGLETSKSLKTLHLGWSGVEDVSVLGHINTLCTVDLRGCKDVTGASLLKKVTLMVD
jgi:hypothetical protein